MTNLENFRKLWIWETVLEALRKKGFEEPSPIQEQVIPLLLKENINIIWQAQTGTGKTAAFGVPLIEKITRHESFTQALVLAPTRELAIQVAEEINSFQVKANLNVVTIYGWQSYDLQLRWLKKWADIVVWTPGRVIDHMKRWTLKLNKIRYIILDEADEMLNMWFIEDIEEILKSTPESKNMLLFSATMPPEILKIAKKYMKDYQMVKVKKEQLTPTQTDQIYFEVSSKDKFEALCRIVDVEPNFYGIVFCKTKLEVSMITDRLIKRGYDAGELHWDIQQKQRETTLNRFKKKQTTILVATDVAARWIDVNDISHVINYTLPWDAEAYVHRIWRTWRAGKKWTAITFVTASEYKKILFFKKITKTDIALGQIPQIKDIINKKKNQIKENIESQIVTEQYVQQLEFAKDILSEIDADKLVASLLSIFYKNELSESFYNEMDKVSIDKSWKSRLFIALWRNKWYTPKTLVDFVVEKTKIDSRTIDEVRVMDDFSFITVPFEEAEYILHTFDKQKDSWQRSIVSKAKDKGKDFKKPASNSGRKDYSRENRPFRRNTRGR